MNSFYPTIPTTVEASQATSTQVNIPYLAPTHAPVTHDNPSLPPAEYATQNKPFSSAYQPRPEDSMSKQSQQEQSPEPQSTSQTPDGDMHIGQLNHYEVGLGACGHNSAGQGGTGNIVALSKFLYDPANTDTNPNHNTLCGRTIVIKGSNGKISHATVLDRCEGCKINDIDVSHKVFKEIWGKDP